MNVKMNTLMAEKVGGEPSGSKILEVCISPNPNPNPNLVIWITMNEFQWAGLL